jgi:hypothetical protein
MERREATGKRGEAIFVMDIMNFCGNSVPFFNPIFLGEKAEAVDYLVELVGVRGATPFFFVQVKTTKRGYTAKKSDPRLRVNVTHQSIKQIEGYPAPTYLIGVDEIRALSFIVAILEGTQAGISSVSTRHPLNADNLRKLWFEVREYWNQRSMTMSDSVFTDSR